jgi:PBP1b-binding outer membrane lipoprotein LpoB
MNRSLSLASTATAMIVAFILSSCSTQEQSATKPASTPAAPAPAAKAETKAAPAEAKAEKAPEKAKAQKVSGDVGLLDTEKNYMILVTKEGKLITLDFDPKTKATQIDPTPAKMTDIGLGSSATVVYEKAGDKGVASSVEFKPAKGE